MLQVQGLGLVVGVGSDINKTDKGVILIYDHIGSVNIFSKMYMLSRVRVFWFLCASTLLKIVVFQQ